MPKLRFARSCRRPARRQAAVHRTAAFRWVLVLRHHSEKKSSHLTVTAFFSGCGGRTRTYALLRCPTSACVGGAPWHLSTAATRSPPCFRHRRRSARSPPGTRRSVKACFANQKKKDHPLGGLSFGGLKLVKSEHRTDSISCRVKV